MADGNHRQEEDSDKIVLLQLPDEMLLEVLRHVGTPELLQLRGLCRSLRDLVPHPVLWRNRDLSDDEDCFAAALRLAPCIRNLGIKSSGALEFCGPLTATSPCAAESLNVLFRDKEAGLVQLVVQNQAALGRLKRLRLELQTDVEDCYGLFGTIPSGRTAGVLRAVCSIEGLVELELLDDDDGERHEVSGSLVPKKLLTPFLRKFVTAPLIPESYSSFWLESHAKTLEHVQLAFPEYDLSPSNNWGMLLSAAPCLRIFGCPVVPNLPALLQCPRLECVRLDVYKSDDSKLAGAVEFLRRSVQLKEVTLRFNKDPVQKELEVLLALAASGRSAVEKLSLEFGCYYIEKRVLLSPLFVAAFAAALTGLPRLRVLRIHGAEPTAGVLEAIDFVSAPGLRILGVTFKGVSEYCYQDTPPPPCVHSFIHRQAVVDLQQRNPGLSLCVPAWERCVDNCADCSSGCHQAMTDREPGADRVFIPSKLPGTCGFRSDLHFHSDGTRQAFGVLCFQ